MEEIRRGYIQQEVAGGDRQCSDSAWKEGSELAGKGMF